MAEEKFQDFLQDPTQKLPSSIIPNPASTDKIIKEIEADNEKQYLQELKKKNKDYLIGGLTLLERERIAQYIVDRYNEVIDKHRELCDKIDEWDETYRMVRKSIPGDDGDMPNYVTPLSTVTLEVVHANIMNVFFTPKDIMRVLPTEEGDVPKVKKLSVFGNWSAKNELDIFNQCDRLFHNSAKIGECPYIVHWVKEYGTEIVREIIVNPADPSQPLIDPDTQQPLFIEREVPKLLYNGPKLEIFSRKDYLQPLNATMDKTPEWEMRIVRYTYDEFLREELQGKMYAGSIQELRDWGAQELNEIEKEDFEGDPIPLGAYEKEFVEFYGRLRIKVIKNDAEDELEEYEELEDEFIAIVNIEDRVLCSLRKNKFPLKMRPIGVDYFIPDDEGRRRGIGIMEFMSGPQKCYDALYNQYIFGTIQANNPVIFFTPMGNMRNEPLKMRNGYMYPTADPNSIKMFQFPQPSQSLQMMLDLVRYWSQLLFGISDYAAGMESKIDPSAPAKKAEIVVAQGSVRLNMIIKRKLKTLKDIFKRWYLLYRDNMPSDKFMRIAGDSKDNPWKFEKVTLSDFALKSIPDFELTGNILNVNKSYEANKAITIYNIFISNPFFQPTTAQGMQALHALTKWLADKLDETGLSRFIPAPPGDIVYTPEEENARFLQGDEGHPTPNEDHVHHIRVHRSMLVDLTIPDEVKQRVVEHINEHVKMMQEIVTQQMVMSEMGYSPQQLQQTQGGTQNAVTTRTSEIPTRETKGIFSEQTAGVV